MPSDPAPNQLMRYAGLAFQMMAIIGLCTWLGVWLDRRLALSTPWFTLGLAVFGVVGAMVYVIRDVNRDAQP